MNAPSFVFKTLLMLLLLPFGAYAQQVTTVATNLPAAGIAVDSAHTLYVSNTNKIFKIPVGGTPVLFAASNIQPAGMLIDPNGDVIVADKAHIDRYNPVTASGPLVAGHLSIPGHQDGPAASAQFVHALVIARNPANGDFVVGQTQAGFALRKISGGMVSSLYDGSTQGHLFVRGLAVDAVGNVYFTGWPSHSVRKMSPSGVITVLAGSDTTSGYVDGTGSQALFDNPWGIVLDANGNLLVADRYNHRIRMITPAGMVSTYAGSGANAEIDGAGLAAAFKSPAHMALHADGTLYVTDVGAHTIRKIVPNRRRIAGPPVLTANAVAMGGLLGVNPGVACGQWGVMRLKHYNAVNDVVCGGSYTVRAGDSLEFNINYGCVTNGNACVTTYKASITTPSGANSVVTMANPAQWSYAFTQPGTYLVSFQASCNATVCQNTCPYSIVVK